jgi:hypothetical protein
MEKSQVIEYAEVMSTLARTLIEEIKAAPQTVQQEVFEFLARKNAMIAVRTMQ